MDLSVETRLVPKAVGERMVLMRGRANVGSCVCPARSWRCAKCRAKAEYLELCDRYGEALVDVALRHAVLVECVENFKQISPMKDPLGSMKAREKMFAAAKEG